ncbi:MAG: glycine cleavage system protein GcvH [Leptospirales bacterium]|nr:glycine cleavage system protein GcvH [Leptospirales bacterium]
MKDSQEKGMNIPDDLKYHENHQWLKIVDDITVICGITDFLQDSFGEISLVEFINKILNSEIETGEKIAIVESTKNSIDIKAICSGRVIEINRVLEESPELINSDPYGDGWIYKIEVEDITMVNDILDPDEYLDIIFTDTE